MASKFWVGGGTNNNWNASPVTNWANSSGGAGNQTAPTTGDDVFFDNGSGTGASTWNTAISLNSLDCTNSRNAITHNAVGITISGGNLVLPTGVGGTYTTASASAVFTITGTSGTQQIKTNGFIPGGLVLNGAGGTFQLQDNLTILANVSSNITLTAGTFDCQSFTVATPVFSSNNANTRELKGSGAWTIGSANVSGSIWNVSSTLTLTNFSSTINITGTTASARTFAGSTLTYPSLSLGANTSGGNLALNGGMTITSLGIAAGPNFITFPSSTTTTITNAFSPTGSSGNEIGISAGTIGTQATVSCANAGTFSYCAPRDLAFAGGGNMTMTNSIDLGHNTISGGGALSITPPSAGGPVGQQCQ